MLMNECDSHSPYSLLSSGTRAKGRACLEITSGQEDIAMAQQLTWLLLSSTHRFGRGLAAILSKVGILVHWMRAKLLKVEPYYWREGFELKPTLV